MPLDTRIALGVQPLKLENPMNQLAQFLQVQGAQRQNQLGEMQMRQAEKAERDAEAERVNMNALNDLYRTALKPDGSIDRAALFQGVAQRGQGSRIPGMQADFAKADKELAGVDKARAEVDKLRFETAEKGYNAFRNVMGSLRGVPGVTAETVNAQIMGLVKAGLLPPERGQEFVSQTPTDPAELAAAIDKASRQELTPEQRFTVFAPKPTQVDDGQTLAFRDTNPNSQTFGQTTAGGVTQKQVTPGDKLSSEDRARALAQQAREAAAGRAVTMRGQNMTDARARESNAATAAQGGKPPPGYRFKPDGSLEAIPGGPADIKAGAEGAKREASRKAAVAQADRVISKVDQALGNVGYTTAGIGAGFRNIPGTPARNLEADLDTIKANLGFAELQAMRDASPTGGALGAIAVQELTALQATVASLEQRQSPEQLRARLGEIKKHYENWKNVTQQAQAADAGGAAPAASPNTPQRQSGKVDLGGGFTLN